MNTTLLYGLSILSLTGLLLLLLDPLTRSATELCEWFEAEVEADNKVKLHAPPPSTRSPPPDETAGHHLRQVLSEVGVLGFLSIPLFVLITPINVYLLAEGFEYLLDRRGYPLGLGLSLFGVPLTDLHAYGLLPTAALILVGGALASARQAGLGMMFRFVLALVALMLVSLEVGVSGARTYALMTNMDTIQSIIFIISNLTLGLVCPCMELTCGTLIVTRWLIPSMRFAAWLLLGPIQTANDSLAHRKTTRLMKAPFVARFGRWLDKGLVSRFRALDAFCARLLPAFLKEKGHE